MYTEPCEKTLPGIAAMTKSIVPKTTGLDTPENDFSIVILLLVKKITIQAGSRGSE